MMAFYVLCCDLCHDFLLFSFIYLASTTIFMALLGVFTNRSNNRTYLSKVPLEYGHGNGMVMP